jgi:chemotaxis protein histidine kinase CheA
LRTRVDVLVDSFRQGMRRDVDRLRYLLNCARPAGRTELREIQRIAHSIRGSGSMFGFPDVSSLGDAMEHLAESLLMGLEPGTAELAGPAALRLGQLTEEISRALAAAPARSASIFSRLGATDEADAEKYRSAPHEAGADHG